MIALTMLNSAYMARSTARHSARSIPGQREAATSLGFASPRLRHRVFPQAIRVALPSLVNQFVDIVKDSSIIAIIGTTDLLGSRTAS